MRIGVIFPCNEIGGDTGAIRAYVQATEDLGFAHLEVFDHVVGEPSNYAGRLWREPFVLLSYLAAITNDVELTTGIIILPQRQTALAAKQGDAPQNIHGVDAPGLTDWCQCGRVCR